MCFQKDIYIIKINMLYYDRIKVSEGVDVDKKVHQKDVIFITFGIFQIRGLSFNQMFEMNLMIY